VPGFPPLGVTGLSLIGPGTADASVEQTNGGNGKANCATVSAVYATTDHGPPGPGIDALSGTVAVPA
jgi:hypothetical protein